MEEVKAGFKKKEVELERVSLRGMAVVKDGPWGI